MRTAGSFFVSSLLLALEGPNSAEAGVPEECATRIRLVEVGPREIAIAVEHAVPMLGLTVKLVYPSEGVEQPQDRIGPDYTIGAAGYVYVGDPTCPRGGTKRIVAINWETFEPGGLPPGEHIPLGLLFRGLSPGDCARVEIDCDGYGAYFMKMDRSLVNFACAEGVVDVCNYEAEVFSRGDVNGDGLTDISDAVRILEYLFTGGSDPPCLDAADAADDGRLSISSAIYILAWRFNGDSPPPLPGPYQCGVDPSADSLDCASYAPCPFE